MKKGIVGLVMATAIVLAMSAQADQPSKHPSTVVTGELVDTGCYLGHSSKGLSHAECAAMCISEGMPMGCSRRRARTSPAHCKIHMGIRSISKASSLENS